MTKRWIAGACLLALAAGALGCGQGPAKPKRGAVVERLPRLEVTAPMRKLLIRKLELAATVEAMKKVDLSARVPGVVAKLDDDMDIGRAVEKDEVLLRLAVPDLEAEKEFKVASWKQAQQQEKVAAATLLVARKEVEETKKDDKRFQAEVDVNRSKYARISKLVKENAQDRMTQDESYKLLRVAEAALESNKVRAEKREARVEAAKEEATLAAKKTAAAKAEVDKLVEQINFATIRAPFKGVITKRWVDPGATITGPTVTLLTLMQIDHVRVLIDVPQRDVDYLNDKEHNPNKDGMGDKVLVRFPSLVGRVARGEIEGQVTRVARSLDPVTRTMRAEVVIPNPEVVGQTRKGDKRKQYALRPGMYGSASLEIENRSNVLVLPATALVRRGEGEVVVYQVADVTGEGDERRGTLKVVRVEVGIDDGKEVEIRDTPEGLKGGELVVLRASSQLRPDEKVLAVSAREPEK